MKKRKRGWDRENAKIAQQNSVNAVRDRNKIIAEKRAVATTLYEYVAATEFIKQSGHYWP